MVRRRSPARGRLLADMGENIKRWRKLQGMSATQLADRAYVTRETLRHIETGTGSPRLDSVMAVLGVLGLAETVVSHTNPFNSDAGRALMDDQLEVDDRGKPNP